jgi:hypothetical protein
MEQQAILGVLVGIILLLRFDKRHTISCLTAAGQAQN